MSASPSFLAEDHSCSDIGSAYVWLFSRVPTTTISPPLHHLEDLNLLELCNHKYLTHRERNLDILNHKRCFFTYVQDKSDQTLLHFAVIMIVDYDVLIIDSTSAGFEIVSPRMARPVSMSSLHSLLE